MLLLTKKGLKPFNLKDFTKIGIEVFFLDENMTELEVVTGLSKISNAEARRKIKEGAVWLGDERVTNPNDIIGKGNVALTLFIGKEFQGLIV